MGVSQREEIKQRKEFSKKHTRKWCWTEKKVSELKNNEIGKKQWKKMHNA